MLVSSRARDRDVGMRLREHLYAGGLSDGV